MNIANTMTDDERWQRAREAAIVAGNCSRAIADKIRAGGYDDHGDVAAAHRALCDLDKPLSEIVPPPPLDPDLALARKVAADWLRAGHHPATADEVEAGEYDFNGYVKVALAAIRAARGAA